MGRTNRSKKVARQREQVERRRIYQVLSAAGLTDAECLRVADLRPFDAAMIIGAPDTAKSDRDELARYLGLWIIHYPDAGEFRDVMRELFPEALQETPDMVELVIDACMVLWARNAGLI